MSTDDTFTLYDLRIEVVAGRGEMVCNHQPGDWFELSGENLSFHLAGVEEQRPAPADIDG